MGRVNDNFFRDIPKGYTLIEIEGLFFPIREVVRAHQAPRKTIDLVEVIERGLVIRYTTKHGSGTFRFYPRAVIHKLDRVIRLTDTGLVPIDEPKTRTSRKPKGLPKGVELVETGPEVVDSW
jgi:hypothetical protein